MSETDTEIRLRRAKEALQRCMDIESNLRKELARASKSTAQAKERYEELFMRNEREQVEILKAERRYTA